MSYALERPALPLQPAVLTAVVVAHLLFAALLLLSRPATTPLAPPKPLYVQWVTPPAEQPAPTPPTPPPPAPEPVKPQPETRQVTPKPPPPRPAPSPEPVAPVETSPAPAEPAPAAPPPASEAAPVAVTAPAAPPPAPATESAELPVQPPRYDLAYLSNPAPRYPARSIELGEEGTVVLEALVGADGRVKRVQVRQSSGSRRLDQAALQAVRRWKFQPSKRGDTPIEGVAIIPMPFTLKQQ